MAIQPLPESSVRALGSGQVLTDPVSLVKELIENSLDAAATQISIEVSQNLLDSLQVKDNGYGIPEADRDAACVRYCTSKIRSFSDISGCRTLGFRGEALASAAELSGSMLLTTRVEGESVAVACDIGRDGKVKSRKNVSTPQGTTVRVTGFLKSLPVRRENALKNAKKYLTKLRALVATYYLSQPRCRISLRILASPQKSGAKGTNEDIVYAPSKSIPEAALKVIGKEGAGACEWICFPDGEESDGTKVKVKALLLKPGSNPAAVSKKLNCTHFVFVDSRPVSCSRGTLKQILSLYRSYLKSSIETASISLADPFLYLNMLCPTGTYDPNVEPAKDDVLFDDSEGMLKTVEDLFKSVYGELPEEHDNGRKTVSKPKAGDSRTRAFDVLLARKRDTPAPLVIDEDEERLAAQELDKIMDQDIDAAGTDEAHPQKGSEPAVDAVELQRPATPLSSSEQTLAHEESHTDDGAPITLRLPVQSPNRKEPVWGSNMSGGYEEEDDIAESREDEGILPNLDDEAIEAELAQVRKDVTLSNPWTAAKLATSSSSPFRRVPPAPNTPVPNTQSSSPHGSPSRPLTHRRDEGNGSPPQAINRTPRQKPYTAFYPTPSTTQSGVRKQPSTKHARLSDPSNAGAMDAFLVRTPRSEATSPPILTRAHGRESVAVPEQRQRPFQEDVDAEDAVRELRAGTRLRANHGFITAADIHRENGDRDVAMDADDDLYSRPNMPSSTRPSKRRRLYNDASEDETAPVANRLQTRDPHYNRYLRASAALNKFSRSIPELPVPSESAPESSEKQDEPPSLPSNTIIASPATSRPLSRRRRTRSLLPLDAIPPREEQTCSLVKTLPLTSIWSWRNRFKEVRESDPDYSYKERTRPHREMFFSSGGEKGAELKSVVRDWLRGAGAVGEDWNGGFEMETSEDGYRVLKACEEPD